MTKHLVFLSIPGLRPADVDAETAPTLHGWAARGALASVAPSFPCVTSPVQASMWTGRTPQEHGVIANGFYHRDRREVELWVGRNGVVEGPQIWDLVRKGGLTSAVWHTQNIKDAAADFIVTPEPIHEPDGSTRLWCYSKPDGLYQTLVDDFGHFPLQHFWGPLANIESSRWILNAAMRLIERHSPNFHYIYLPHLDYASQKYGPNSGEAKQAVRDLDGLLRTFDLFIQSQPIAGDAVYLAVSEYAMTDVSGVVYPNRLLENEGLLQIHETVDGKVVDLRRSDAFAMVDHQCAHVYAHPECIDRVAMLFKDSEGIDGVYTGADRGAVGLNHARSGDVVLSARPDHWFAYYWWDRAADAPPFAKTVDIHRKPGYDAVELFFDPETKSIPLDASLVRGSHGAPVRSADQHGAIVCSRGDGGVDAGRTYRDTDLYGIATSLLGLSA